MFDCMLVIWLSEKNGLKKLREDIAFTNKTQDTKMIVKALNVPRDTNGSIVCKFNVKRTVVALPGQGR